MKNKTKDLIGKFKSDSGLVIVEATFIFPVMFFVLFFMLFLGNAYYLKAVVTDYVVEAAIKGAAYVADPYLEGIKANEKAISSVQVSPYRYLFDDMGDIKSKIREELIDNITESSGFFSGMTPSVTSNDGEITKYNNKVLYSTFIVEVTYTIKFPMRFLGDDSATMLTLSSRAEAPVGDQAEFIRNTDMVLDLLEGSKEAKFITDIFGKVKSFIEQFAAR